MTRAAKFNIDGEEVDIVWESKDFSSFGLSKSLATYGVYIDENDGSINVSDLAGYDYQKHAALHEYFCTNSEKLKLLGVDCCADLEKKIILEIVPTKKRERYIRQRIIMFSQVIIQNGPESKIHDSLKKSRDMLVDLLTKI